jgi:altronate dehydratase
VSGDAVHQPTWLLLLKIEHMVKLQVFGNNSKTVNNIKNLTLSKNDQRRRTPSDGNSSHDPLGQVS